PPAPPSPPGRSPADRYSLPRVSPRELVPVPLEPVLVVRLPGGGASLRPAGGRLAAGAAALGGARSQALPAAGGLAVHEGSPSARLRLAAGAPAAAHTAGNPGSPGPARPPGRRPQRSILPGWVLPGFRVR